MKVSQINITNFMGGTIWLKNIKPEEFGSFGSIKNLAEGNEIDIEISQIIGSKGMHFADVYIVTASKQISENKAEIIQNENSVAEAAKSLVTSLKISKEELSVRLFNTFINAVETLQKQISNIK